MAAEWTINRVVFAPQVAADLLNDMEDRNTRHNKRVNELLEANNRYLNEARAARDELNALKERILGYRG